MGKCVAEAEALTISPTRCCISYISGKLQLQKGSRRLLQFTYRLVQDYCVPWHIRPRKSSPRLNLRHISRGAGTFSEKGALGKTGIGAVAPIFSKLCPPLTFEFAHPEFSVLGGQMRIVAHPSYKM